MDDRPILICYDDSKNARSAIDAAAALLNERHAVVLDVAPVLTPVESVATLSALTPSFADVNRDDALARARTGAVHARKAGFTAEARADVAAPTWGGVVDVAKEIGAAAIVIGSRGLAGARELFEGSLSHEVAEHAGRPVLIVPPAAPSPRTGRSHRSQPRT
jgi:nucleotide-binding universal stress UspA family protein